MNLEVKDKVLYFIHNNQGTNCTKIHMKTNVSYAAVLEAVKLLEVKGYISTEKEGREILCRTFPKAREYIEIISKAVNYTYENKK